MTCNLFFALSTEGNNETELRSEESAMIVGGFGKIGSSFLVPMEFCSDEPPMKLGLQDDGTSLGQLS